VLVWRGGERRREELKLDQGPCRGYMLRLPQCLGEKHKVDRIWVVADWNCFMQKQVHNNVCDLL
jgi:hypothetical protein